MRCTRAGCEVRPIHSTADTASRVRRLDYLASRDTLRSAVDALLRSAAIRVAARGRWSRLWASRAAAPDTSRRRTGQYGKHNSYRRPSPSLRTTFVQSRHAGGSRSLVQRRRHAPFAVAGVIARCGGRGLSLRVHPLPRRGYFVQLDCRGEGTSCSSTRHTPRGPGPRRRENRCCGRCGGSSALGTTACTPRRLTSLRCGAMCVSTDCGTRAT